MEDQKVDHQHQETSSTDSPVVVLDSQLDDLVLHGKYGTTAIDDEDFKLTIKTYITVASVSMLSLAITLAVSGPSGLVSFIVRDVGGATNATWIVNSTNILQGVMGPPLGLIADLYGRRWTLITLTCFGIVGTFVSGSGHTIGQVIAGQAITGLGLALKPICYAVASEVLPRKYRAVVQYWISILAGLGGLIGAIGGPALIRRSITDGWRWFFYLEGGLFIVSLAGIVLFYRPPPRDVKAASRTMRERFLAFDWIGWFLLTAGFSLLVAGLAFGGNRFPWKSGNTLGPLVSGALILVGFVFYEIYGRTDGLCHHELFREKNFALSLIGIALEGALLYAVLTVYSAEVLKLWTTDALHQGLRLIPFWLGNTIASIPMAYLTTRFKDVKIQLITGYSFFLIAFILWATASVDRSTQSVVADGIAGVGFAAPLTLLFVVAQLTTPPALIATSTALMSTSRALSAAVAVAIYSAISVNKVGSRLGPYIGRAMVQAGLPASQVAQKVPLVIGSVNKGFVPALVPGVTPAVLNAAFAAARQAYQEAYRYVWICAACFCVPALVVTILMSSIKEHMNARIDAPAEDVHASAEKSRSQMA